MNTKKEYKTKYIAITVILSMVMCLALWVGGICFTHWYANNYFTVGKTDNAPALFGDSFGAVNALISAFAFAGLIIMIWLQRKDLEMQRQEMQKTTEELELQRKQFELQNQNLAIQRFESTLFQMISIHNEITDSLNIEVVSNRLSGEMKLDNVRGREIFKLFYNNKTKGGNTLYMGLKDWLEHPSFSAMAYQDYPHISILDHYFRNLLQILRFINNAPIPDLSFEERKNYVTIVISTLSEYELVFLMLNAIHFNDCNMPEYMTYINKYSLLDELRVEIIGDRILNLFKGAFDDNAFTRSMADNNNIL